MSLMQVLTLIQIIYLGIIYTTESKLKQPNRSWLKNWWRTIIAVILLVIDLGAVYYFDYLLRS